MKPINILWIVDHLGYNGIMHGAGKYYLNTIPYFNKQKFNVTLCVVRKSDEISELFENANISIRHLGKSKFDPRTLFELTEIIKSEKIQLIHTHGYGSDNFGRVVGKILGIPTIIHAHDDNSHYFFSQNIADLLLILFTQNAIAVSETVKNSCVKKRRISEKKIKVLHNGIQLQNFVNLTDEQIRDERLKYQIIPDNKIIGAVGRLRKEKGVRYLIEAVPQIIEKYPNVTFFIAGDGPQKDELQNLSKKLGVEKNIIFAGFCSNIPSVLSMCDIFVSPSLTEGSPLGILEAMAMAKPIVATSVGGVTEILVNNKTGLLVPSENPTAIAENVIELLKDDLKAKLLSENAAEEIKNYDMSSYIKKIEDYYTEILDK